MENPSPGSRLGQPRNTVFTGCETDLLIRTNQLFHKAPRPVAIIFNRPGGFGKSQIAGELCGRSA